MTADISVIFPYYNEEKSLAMTLALVSSQTLMPREVIFVNSMSTDGSSMVIDEWIAGDGAKLETQFHNICEGTTVPSSSKNVGIRWAKCDWVAFMDCGLIFPRDWLEQQWKYMEKNGAEVVSGLCFFGGEGVIDKCAIAQTYGYNRLRPTIPSTMVRKDVFERAGLFMENRRSGYDVAWALSLESVGVKRGINSNVVIRYDGINFADSIKRVLVKNMVYSHPTVGMKGYYVPYYYCVAAVIAIILVILSVRNVAAISLFYFIVRGYAVPCWKSRGAQLLREKPGYWVMLPFIGMIIDIGRFVGTMKGIYVYHIRSLVKKG